MKASPGHRSKRLLILKIDLPALLAFALFAGLIFFYLIPGFKKVMMERKRDLIHEMTASVYSLISYYQSLEAQGVLSTDDAKLQALSAVSKIRYGENQKDYFWVTDTQPRMMMHPYRSDLDGEDLTGFRDSKGKAIFVEFVREVSASGESYVDYMWQWNDDSTRIVPKLSYVRLFKPWDWVIGTGIYVDDVRSEIRALIIRALIISGIIGVLILILLSVMSRQSHAIEEKRKEAEAALHKSRELYRTLAEAATEGVMIWSGQGLQANKTILSWLGYADTELHPLRLMDVYQSPETEGLQDAAALYHELETSMHTKGRLKSKEGKLISTLGDFSRIDLNGMQAVLAVFRPASSLIATPDFVPQPTLFQAISTGFFRISYGRRNRFIYASKPTIELLGYQDLRELQVLTIESFFADPLHFKTFRLVLSSEGDFLNQQVLLKHKNGGTFWAMVNVKIVKSGDSEVYCDGTIEPLAAAAFPPQILGTDLRDYSATFIVNQPVSAIMRKPVTVPDVTPIRHAAQIMKEHTVQSLLVVQKEGEPLGILDMVSIAHKLSEGNDPGSPAYQWMVSPPPMISKNAPVREAFSLVADSKCPLLLVKDDAGNLCGTVSQQELDASFATAPELLLNEIQSALSTEALRRIYQKSQQIAISMIHGGADPQSISMYISAMADALCRRAIALCIEPMGPPPCRFAFIQTGSAGRQEQTFATDQDNGIIFEDQGKERDLLHQKYFLALGEKVNEMLSIIGFELCKGGNMAGNPRWCQPLSRWKDYFTGWIQAPGPEELLDVSIFFDFRYAFGEENLVGELRNFVSKGLHTSDIFFHHMAAAWMPFTPSGSQLEEGKADLKRLLLPLVGIIRMYSLKNGVSENATVERIIGLYAGKYMDHKLLKESLVAWKNLTTLRLSHQLANIVKGITPNNIINYQMDNADAIHFLRHAIETIQHLMQKSAADFHTGNA